MPFETLQHRVAPTRFGSDDIVGRRATAGRSGRGATHRGCTLTRIAATAWPPSRRRCSRCGTSWRSLAATDALAQSSDQPSSSTGPAWTCAGQAGGQRRAARRRGRRSTGASARPAGPAARCPQHLGDALRRKDRGHGLSAHRSSLLIPGSASKMRGSAGAPGPPCVALTCIQRRPAALPAMPGPACRRTESSGGSLPPSPSDQHVAQASHLDLRQPQRPAAEAISPGRDPGQRARAVVRDDERHRAARQDRRVPQPRRRRRDRSTRSCRKRSPRCARPASGR